MSSIWNKIEEISNPSKNQGFGWSISYGDNSNILAISAPLSDISPSKINAGIVEVYDVRDLDYPSLLGKKLEGKNPEEKFGFSIDISNDGKILAVGSPGNDNNGFVSIYELKDNSWSLLGDRISGDINNNSFGWALNLEDNGLRIAIGDPYYDSTEGSENVGSVDIYEFIEESGDSGFWKKLGQTIYGNEPNSNLGYSLDFDNNIVAIGAPQKDLENKSGFVSIYYLNNNLFTQLGNNITGEENTDESGASISLTSPNNELDGSIVAIGAMKNDGNYLNNTGHVRVYEYDQNKNEWAIKGNDIDGSDIGDLSSYSLDISKDGNLISIGSLEHDYLDKNNSGQVRIFDFDDSSNLWRQSGFDIGGYKVNEGFGAALSISEDGNSIAISSLNGGSNNAGEVQIYNLGETTYPVTPKDVNNENAIIRYSYKLVDSEGKQVTGVNLWSLDDSGQTIFDEFSSQQKYDLVIEAKTTDVTLDWNIETIDLTINLADGVFSNLNTAEVEFSSDINFAKSYTYLDDNYFTDIYSESKEGIRVTGAMGNEIAGSNKINSSSFKEIFRIKDLFFNPENERGTENGETLTLDFISNDFETTISNYQDTDNNGLVDNAFISSLNELGYDETNLSIEIDRGNEIYTYQTFAKMVEHGTTLWTQREIGSEAKSFLIRNGSTVNGRSWWSNIGNFETELSSIKAENLDSDENNLSLINYGNVVNMTNLGENTVSGYSVTQVSNDGNASSWDDTTTESFFMDLEVRVKGTEGQSLIGESFYKIDGDDFKDNNSVFNNSNLLSKNIITFQGDLNYDGRVSLIDLAYLNAGKIYADQNSFIATNDVDANFDGQITVSDIAILEKDFLRSIHQGIDHHSSWDETSWQVPTIDEGDTQGLRVGSISQIDTLIHFDNASFIFQQNLDNEGIQNSINPFSDPDQS